MTDYFVAQRLPDGSWRLLDDFPFVEDLDPNYVLSMGAIARSARASGRWLVILCFMCLVLGGCLFQRGAASGPDVDARAVQIDGGSDAGSADAGNGSDAAAPDAAPIDVTLSETTTQTAASGHGIYCTSSQLTIDNAWYRIYHPADYAIVYHFHVTHVFFTSEAAKSANVTVAIYDYAGMVGDVTLSALGPLRASITGTVPNSDSVQNNLDAPFSGVDIAIGAAFVVKISAADVQNSQGIKSQYFHLGANSAGQTAPGYYSSGTCGESTPTSQSGADFVINVEGWY